MGAFKWHALGLDYQLDGTPAAPADLTAQVVALFQEEGCRAR
jgi:pyruvate formate lyase activating enzyme